VNSTLALKLAPMKKCWLKVTKYKTPNRQVVLENLISRFLYNKAAEPAAPRKQINMQRWSICLRLLFATVLMTLVGCASTAGGNPLRSLRGHQPQD
jgi:hypothetical protein